MTFKEKQLQLAWDFGEDLAFKIERCLVSDTDESPTLTELFEAATGGLNDAGSFYSDTEHQDHHPRNCHSECEVWIESRKVDLRAKKDCEAMCCDLITTPHPKHECQCSTCIAHKEAE